MRVPLAFPGRERGAAELHRTGVSRRPSAAPRGRSRLDRRLLERPRATRCQAAGYQPRPCVQRVQDERRSTGLAAAIVDRLRVHADVHREPLSQAQRSERDVQRDRVRQVRQGPRAAFVPVNVTRAVEFGVLPERSARVRCRCRAEEPVVLVSLNEDGATDIEERASRRRARGTEPLGSQIRARVIAHDRLDRVAHRDRKIAALRRRRRAVRIRRFEFDSANRDPQAGTWAHVLLVGLPHVDVRGGALRRSRRERIERWSFGQRR